MGVYSQEGDVDAHGAEEVNLRTSSGAELVGQQVSSASLPVVIASDQTPIPAVVAGGYYNSFAVSGERTAIGTTELPVLLFRNPTGSAKTVYPKQIIVANRHTVSSIMTFRVYVSPTVTSTGTALTEASTNLGAGISISADAFTSPTISGNGTLIAAITCAGGTAAIPAIINLLPKFTMAANTAILITAVSDGSSRIALASIFWEEN